MSFSPTMTTPYSSSQLETLVKVHEMLEDAGLQAADLFTDSLNTNTTPFPPYNNPINNFHQPLPTMFTEEEILSGIGRLTLKSQVHGIIYHKPGAVIEFPVTDCQTDMAIAHCFPVSLPEYIHPKENVQYSLGGSHGGHNNILCHLLFDKDTGEAVRCKQTRYNCCAMKTCSFNKTPHGTSFTSTKLDAWGEVFMKTLGFFCALQEHGCSFPVPGSMPSESDSESDVEVENSVELVLLHKDCRSPSKKSKTVCQGKLLLEKDKFGHFFIRCEYFVRNHRNHLRIRSLTEYNVDYLGALFKANKSQIFEYEILAARYGYGPLAPCNEISTQRGQKELCSNWHRNEEGILQRGRMESKHTCPTYFEFYEPNDLVQTPFILMVCRNPHSHSAPPRSKTPPAIQQKFNSLLRLLDWRLANATQRSVLADSTFMHGLRCCLDWKGFQDPDLADLHPSLGNRDHAARLITQMCGRYFPEGTGLEGARLLLERQKLLPTEQQYLRCIETFHNGEEGTFNIVVCMSQDMSRLLLEMKRPTFDTSFKRIQSWQEFEIEAWFSEYGRSITVSRAFTTSQTAFAHYMLFKIIFSIAEQDTGKRVRFRHIHGDGIDTITVDGHRGQALGLGLYLQETCQSMSSRCPDLGNRALSEMSPREHLTCVLRYCFTHFTRNVFNLRGHVKENVIQAMMSLASGDPLPDFEKTLAIIRAGGKKAVEWLKDKQTSEGFYPLAAIYRPESNILFNIWKAVPSTSNGNEQAHRSINRDGTRLTLLAGIMNGLQFDYRAMANIRLLTAEGIQTRNQVSTHFQRLSRGIKSKSLSQRKNLQTKDKEITRLVDKARQLQSSISSTVETLKRLPEDSSLIERTRKCLKKSDEALQEAHSQLNRLLPQGSGSVSLTGLMNPKTFVDPHLFCPVIKKEFSMEPTGSLQTRTLYGVPNALYHWQPLVTQATNTQHIPQNSHQFYYTPTNFT